MSLSEGKSPLTGFEYQQMEDTIGNVRYICGDRVIGIYNGMLIASILAILIPTSLYFGFV